MDVVVFAAPQLSLVELQAVARALEGKRVHSRTALLVATSPEIKRAADRMGLTATVEAAGAVLLRGVCFYQMYARELGEANGWTNLLTNSAKLVNIISGYGYRPVLATTEACIERRCGGGCDGGPARTIRGHPGIGPRVTGEALVAKDDFSARYDLDRVKGVFSRPAHALCGESYVGRVLVLNTAKGGVATSWMLREMSARGMGPAALLLNLATRSWPRAPPSRTYPSWTASNATSPTRSRAAIGSPSIRGRDG